MRYNWNGKKNEYLQKTRAISFEIIVFQIATGKLLDILEHPNQEKYQGQKIFVVDYNDYAFLVPYVQTNDEIFLKTIIPSRKATKKYIGNHHD